MAPSDVERVLTWLLQAPVPQLLVAPRASASARAPPGTPAWLVRLAQACGAVAGRCATWASPVPESVAC